MDRQTFEWELEYEGNWECPSCGEPIKGTLSLRNGNLTLELTDSQQHETDTYVPLILGKVKSRGTIYYIKLLNLKRTRIVDTLGGGDNVYTYNATDVFISDSKKSFTAAIQAVCINSFLLSKWASKGNQNSLNCSLDWGEITFSYLDDETCNGKNGMFRQSRLSSIPMPTCHSGELPTKCFLEIQFTNKKDDFFDVQLHGKRIFNLFLLLSQAPIDVGYNYYTTDKGLFVHWSSLKHRYLLLEKTFAYAYNFKNITPELLHGFVKKWEAVYLEFTNSIDIFFDLLGRELIPTEQRLKTYMSVIDGLTTKYELNGDGQTRDTKRRAELSGILEKVKSSRCLSSGEYNNLVRNVFCESNISLGNRFCFLLNSLQDLLPNRLNETFGYTCTNTRHKLTHVESDHPNVFSPFEYLGVVHDLETIISTYLLKEIGADNDLTRHTLHLP